jgi:hypothetical protein
VEFAKVVKVAVGSAAFDENTEPSYQADVFGTFSGRFRRVVTAYGLYAGQKKDYLARRLQGE